MHSASTANINIWLALLVSLALMPAAPAFHLSWDPATYTDTIALTHSISAPPQVLLERGPHIVEGVAGGKLRNVKPYTREVRAEIDNESELTGARSVPSGRRQP